MSAAIPLINPKTANETAQLNATEMDGVCVCTNTNILGAETITINVLDSKGQPQPLYNPLAGANFVLNAAAQAISLPGGYLYRIDKPNTAAVTGVDYLIKPRTGASGG